ncbi:hypothetical protein ON010_g14650 [Phytophthora cinnamomi]|nr:hypothetical protein ON010_g14650 [Phytophthora cinnamomi]
MPLFFFIALISLSAPNLRFPLTTTASAYTPTLCETCGAASVGRHLELLDAFNTLELEVIRVSYTSECTQHLVPSGGYLTPVDQRTWREEEDRHDEEDAHVHRRHPRDGGQHPRQRAEHARDQHLRRAGPGRGRRGQDVRPQAAPAALPQGLPAARVGRALPHEQVRARRQGRQRAAQPVHHEAAQAPARQAALGPAPARGRPRRGPDVRPGRAAVPPDPGALRLGQHHPHGRRLPHPVAAAHAPLRRERQDGGQAGVPGAATGRPGEAARPADARAARGIRGQVVRAAGGQGSGRAAHGQDAEEEEATDHQAAAARQGVHVRRPRPRHHRALSSTRRHLPHAQAQERGGEGWNLLARLQDEQTSVNGPVPVQNDDATDTADSDDDEAAPAAKPSSASSQKCGFIILKDSADENAPEQFEEFTPFLYAQHLQSHKKVKSFDTFDEAVDEYFSRFEAETAEVAKQSAQLAAENKLAKLKKNQQQQLAQLREVQEQSFQHAQLIEANQQDVENVLLVIRSALASGMDWRGLEELVRYEQKNGNPVASLIHKLDLEHNRVAILLCDDEDEYEGEDGGDGTGEEDKQAHVIWIDLSLSALANAREIYTKKKKAGEKVKKATEATDKAIALAEKNTKKTLEKQQTKRNVIYQRRKTLWFEKFHWFLTNEKYLVVAGKDAHQNELLVKRYLRKGDVYVHADLHGAATCIVRNHATVKDKKTQELPPIPVATLEQAGCMSVCRSNAWTSQVIAGAYWVHADQVSKTAPAGEYLTTGSFMIRGKKNYIQPSRLEMGLAVLFRIDESSISNHSRQGEGRTPRAVEELEEDEDNEDEGEVTPAVEETPQKEQEQEAPDEFENASTQQKVEVAKKVVFAGHENEQEDEEAEEEAPAQQPQRDGKKRLSAKERRDLKKGKQPSREDSIDEQPPAQQKRAKGKDKDKDNSAASAPQQKKSVRGKKGKMKKMKKKYADQDEEDRRLRMEALGHMAEEDQEEDDQSKDDDDSADHSADENGEATGTTSKTEASEEYIRQQREKKEKFLDEQEDEAEGADFFDAFTGEPLADDIVLFAMPMCAPYASLTKFKYKVKLTPGSQKKGKAAKQAMEHFFASNFKDEKDASKSAPYRPIGGDAEDEAQPDVNPIVVQRELMRCIPENELVNCMVGPVKISAPGLHGPNAGGKKGGGKRPAGKPKKKGKK